MERSHACRDNAELHLLRGTILPARRSPGAFGRCWRPELSVRDCRNRCLRLPPKRQQPPPGCQGT
eukprot:1751413-Lingulodinium_polyedra.AAC.1